MPQPHGWLPLKGAAAVGAVMATGHCCPSQRAGIPIGAALVGVVVQRAGLVPTVLGMGAISLLVTLGMFFNRSLRQMDTREPRPDTSPVVK
jgi:predicted MFS family arabinose efflux permease